MAGDLLLVALVGGLLDPLPHPGPLESTPARRSPARSGKLSESVPYGLHHLHAPAKGGIRDRLPIRVSILPVGVVGNLVGDQRNER